MHEPLTAALLGLEIIAAKSHQHLHPPSHSQPAWVAGRMRITPTTRGEGVLQQQLADGFTKDAMHVNHDGAPASTA